MRTTAEHYAEEHAEHRYTKVRVDDIRYVNVSQISVHVTFHDSSTLRMEPKHGGYPILNVIAMPKP